MLKDINIFSIKENLRKKIGTPPDFGVLLPWSPHLRSHKSLGRQVFPLIQPLSPQSTCIALHNFLNPKAKQGK